MKIVYIMRGVSGSGKSTVARILAGSIGVIHSTDQYFGAGDNYKFDSALLTDYHGRNFDAFCQSLMDCVPVVICDNTNSKKWHYESYAKAAHEAGYKIVVIEMTHLPAELAASRSIHNVPLHVIERMIEEWEY